MTPNRPGITPPRLIADLQEFDPSDKARNSLGDVPPVFGKDLPKLLELHTHSLVLRPNRSVLPAKREPDMEKGWIVATICEECRIHIEIEVSSRKEDWLNSSICSRHDAENPLHHLQYVPGDSEVLSGNRITKHSPDRWKDVRVFVCSAKLCPTIVTITTKAPIMNRGFVKLLSNPVILRNRVKRAPPSPDHPGQILTAHHAFGALRSYLKNAINNDQRKIPRLNTKYLTCLSDECAEIMERAHFKKVQEENADFWAPPTPSEMKDINSTTYRDIEDMFDEVLILVDQNRPPDQEPARGRVIYAEKDIKRVLSSDFDVASKWFIDLTQPEHPYYASLGIVADVTDQIVIWAYHRQCQCDPDRAAYYFECLSGIAEGRGSEILQLEVAKLGSQGTFTRTDLVAAYKQLVVDPTEKDEDLIIGIFRSRLADSPTQETQLRDSLRIIGRARNSAKMLRVARKAFMDAKGACDWLQITEETDDQLVLSIYQVRIQDSPEVEPTAKEALKIIAEKRQSPILLSYLEAGSVYGLPLDIQSAYSALGVGDTELTDDLIINVYSCRLEEVPEKIGELRAALKMIGGDRSSDKIKRFLETGHDKKGMQGSPESPVGLENIGNTCYLNSLLQFYFTVKPLRDMILNFDEFQETEISEDVISRKRVGGRKVTKREIERAKKFAEHLRILFENLIKSDASSVLPERDLAYLALVSSKDEAVKRTSMSGELKPSVRVIDVNEDLMEIDRSSLVEDATSEATLVNDQESVLDDHMMVDQERQESKPDDKENMPPLSPLSSAIDQESRPRDLTLDAQDGKIVMDDNMVVEIPLTPPPDRPPPPIPPRPERKNTSTDIDLMFGRQQDVTECIGNVMFQIEAAIKPTRIDNDGEQIDIVKELFYGITKQTLSFPNSSEIRTKEELFSHLLVNVAEGDRDLYSALDNSFDAEQVDLEGQEARRFLSISHLPPVLQIQVQRVQFDREKGSAYKSNAHLDFPEILFMDRYMDTDDPALLTRREESLKWKEELRNLAQRKACLNKTSIGLSAANMLDITREWIERVQALRVLELDDDDIESALVTAIDLRAAAVRLELETIERETKDLESRINQQFTDLRKYGYRLHSVFIHRGSVTFGHYWIYIYDFQKDVFRKYNDQYVTEVVDTSEVLKHSDSDLQPPTPYFLVFVRDDQLDITEAVRREIVIQ